jgi:hypothetical protein
MPMSTPFILSSSSKDLELKGISTVRIPGSEVENDSGSVTGSAITGSDHEGEGSTRSSSPSRGGTRDGDENAGDKAPGGLGVASGGGGTKSSHIDFGGGSAAAKKAKKASSERRKSRRKEGSRTGQALTMASHSSASSPWLRLRKSSKMEAPSLRQRLMSL